MTSALLEQRFRCPEHVHTRRFDREVIVLDLARGEYFALDEVGGVVWDQLVARKSPAEISEHLTAKYDVSLDTARSDVERLVRELIAAGLLEAER
jgi:hypothetical protein